MPQVRQGRFMLCRISTLRAHLALQNPSSYVQVQDLQAHPTGWHSAIPNTIPRCWQLAANTTCQGSCQGSCQGLQRKAKVLCFTISPSSWHEGMRTLGDKGQGHSEHQRGALPHGHTSSSSSEQSVWLCPGTWPCRQGGRAPRLTEHCEWEGGRTRPQP